MALGIKLKKNHKLQLKTSTFVFSAENNSRLQSKSTVKFTFYPDISENRTLRNTSFTPFFQVRNTKFNILGTLLLEKYVSSIKRSSHTLEIYDNDDIKSLKFYDSSIKPPPFYSPSPFFQSLVISHCISNLSNIES